MSGAVDVFVRHEGDDAPVGRLWTHRGRGTESATFRYADEWLARPSAYALEPALPLLAGSLQTEAGRPLFRSFADSAPDRWGRALIKRAEGRRAHELGETPRSISELSYLLGTRDDARQGALRFRRPDQPDFLAPPGSGVPALIDLPDLLAASERFERDEEGGDDLALLVRAGSSLGGARPKAHVRTRDGALAIAKFPSVRADAWNVMAWEKTALDIASAAGLNTPPATLVPVAGRSVLVVERFDRVDGERVGYVSAMTMLEATDGETYSYPEMADAITAHSSATDDDLRELWSRIVLSVLISNTDDHLRNHGFLRIDRAGWRLAPLFDVNPDPEPGNDRLTTSIDGGDGAAGVERLAGVAPYFRLGPDETLGILRRVDGAVSRWRSFAVENGLDDSELRRMEPAFEHDRRKQVRGWIAARVGA